tara:strand:+ start:4807 stop:5091 length:285 start_codon:yes stop_codon:yes gene_type:complete
MVTAGIIQYFTKYMPGKGVVVRDVMMARAPAEAMGAGAPMLEKAVEEAVPAAEQVITGGTSFLTQNIALWFLIGAVFALAVYILVSYIKKDSKQ